MNTVFGSVGDYVTDHLTAGVLIVIVGVALLYVFFCSLVYGFSNKRPECSILKWFYDSAAGSEDSGGPSGFGGINGGARGTLLILSVLAICGSVVFFGLVILRYVRIPEEMIRTVVVAFLAVNLFAVIQIKAHVKRWGWFHLF